MSTAHTDSAPPPVLLVEIFHLHEASGILTLMKHLLLVILFIPVLCGPGRAQAPATACPKIDLAGPSGITMPGDTMLFKVRVDTPEPEKLSYHWTISQGLMLKGQGTSTITVNRDCTNPNVTATVEIGGLPVGCPYQTSETAGVSEGCGGGRPVLIDEYGRISFRKEKLHLDNVVVQLRNVFDGRVVFIIYPQKNNEMTAIRRRVANITKYLRSRGVSKKKFNFVYGKNNSYTTTKIWLVPNEGSLPEI